MTFTFMSLSGIRPSQSRIHEYCRPARYTSFVQAIQPDLPVHPSPQKHSASPESPNHPYIPRRPVPIRGALAIVTNVGTGCGGRGSVGRGRGSQGGFPLRNARERSSRRADERRCFPPSLKSQRTCTCRRRPLGEKRVAYGKAVWSWHPLLVSSRRRWCEPNRVLATPSIRRRGWQDEFVARESAV